ncbi:MAG: glycosyltransferase [Clostridiales bacterium]|nr:glycosyltransferase [Clostridiales bacterium]
MERPVVSVIIPVCNVEKYLRQSLDCILGQTLTDFEVICVDDGSTDQSPAILEEYAQKDTRMKVLRQENRGAGAARNLGFSHATGTYAYFFDADDLCSPELLEKTVARAEETKADIVAFDFIRFHEDGTVENRVGIHADWLPPETEVFSYRDCPDRIMSVINPTPWNKLCRTAFLREHQLKYEEISSSNDIAFSAVSAASAERISFLKEELFQYRVGHANTISSTKSTKLYNVLTAVTSATAQVQALPYYDKIKKAAFRFAIDNYIFALEHNVTDWSSDICRMYYTEIHQYFLQSEFDNLQEGDLHNPELYQSFCIVRKQDYESIMALRTRKLIVSFTSFPPRIAGLSSVLESIYNQSRPADRVILWLAEEQFPQREAELPEELLAFVQAGKLELRWCPEDLKPHKKYFYAMQENPDDIIVTIDDDILYPPNMLRTLYRSYLRYPNAVSTMRANLIVLNEEGTVLPYRYWGKEADCNLNEPFMSLLATGVGGVLYPPHLLPEALFDEQAIQDTCLMADDLWLKTMELLRDVPVVAAAKFQPLKYVPGSQAVALHHSNVDKGANDEQLEQIQRWMEQHYDEPNFWSRKLTEASSSSKISEITAICEYYYRERERLRKEIREFNRKLHQAWTEKSELNRKVKKAYAEKSELNRKLQQACAEKYELNRKLQQAWAEKSELNRKLQKTYAEKSEINRKLQITYGEKFDRGVQIRELKAQLKAAKKAQADLKKQLNQTKKQLKASKKQNASIKRSTSYRLGRILTWPVRRLKRLWKRLKRQ